MTVQSARLLLILLFGISITACTSLDQAPSSTSGSTSASESSNTKKPIKLHQTKKYTKHHRYNRTFYRRLNRQ